MIASFLPKKVSRFYEMTQDVPAFCSSPPPRIFLSLLVFLITNPTIPFLTNVPSMSAWGALWLTQCPSAVISFAYLILLLESFLSFPTLFVVFLCPSLQSWVFFLFVILFSYALLTHNTTTLFDSHSHFLLPCVLLSSFHTSLCLSSKVYNIEESLSGPFFVLLSRTLTPTRHALPVFLNTSLSFSNILSSLSPS